MRVIADVMGSDKGAAELVRGAYAAKCEKPELEITLVGNEGEIRAALEEIDADAEKFDIVHTDEVITMCDDPMCVKRGKSGSSMSVGLARLSEGYGDAFVSAGNTGALFTGATLIVRKIKGVSRPAIATILPMNPPVLLLDSGANINVTPQYLFQFAILGTEYMRKLFGIENPRVGLLNNGEEKTKGCELQRETYELLSEAQEINFVGNIEGNRIPFDACDVLVTDGFTGNITLKSIEGMGKMIMGTLKGMFLSNLSTKLAALMLKSHISKIKKDFDSSEQGGAPILGVSKPVVKAHGSSNAKAYKNAIIKAAAYAECGLIEELSSKADVIFAKKRNETAEQ